MINLLPTPETDTQTEVRKHRSDRDEFQLHFDGRFAKLVEAWKAAGHPAPDKTKADRVTVAKGDVAALKAVIRRAATFHRHGVTFFKDATDAKGNVTVKYVPVAKPVTDDAASNGQTAPATVTQTAPASNQGTQPKK